MVPICVSSRFRANQELEMMRSTTCASLAGHIVRIDPLLDAYTFAVGWGSCANASKLDNL